MMNDEPKKSYIYCTPFLDEIKRIQDLTKIDFKTPTYQNGRKINDFNELLLNGENIVVTHSTFANANALTLEFLKNGNYTLILDEVLDILTNYNEICDDNLTSADIKLLFNEGFIGVDEYGQVTWLKDSYPSSKYFNVERIAKNGNLYYLDKTMLVWQFPAEIFKTFQSVYVLTYLFQGSFLKPYFEYHNLSYELQSVNKQAEKYHLSEYKSDSSFRAQFKELITICKNEKANNYKASSLSKSWFERQSQKELKILQKRIFNYVHNEMKAQSKKIMWTCPKNYRQNLKGKGYNVVRKLTQEEMKLTKKQREELESQLSCYIPLNARATNNFSDRSVLVYAFNFFANPYIKRYFENKNKIDGTSINVDQDYLALSCLIQWVWRSRIRNKQPISIYIPSERMRNLFIKWLNGEM